MATGFTPVNANFLSNTPTASASDIDGTGITFSIENVAVFSFDNASEPLTTDGFYTFGNDTLTHAFTLSGLEAGSIVSLYAVSAWDGVGRGAQVDFGGSLVQAQVVGSPGTTPTLANFTFIGTAIAGLDGKITGTINGEHFPSDPATEGQVGAFIFNVTPVPEPATACLAALGMACVGLRRRRPHA